jgi:uncharacterized protein
MSRAYADMPLHYGRVPKWLAERMSALGVAIVEAIVMEYGKSAVLQRLSDPFWFQSLGCVLGMDWHSSGITTSVMGALKASVNKRSHELGIYICGGRGRYAKETPNELIAIGNRTGLDANALVHSSKLSAKVDNTAIQDGYQIYLHSFIVTNEGEWAVVQQGMNDANGMARRYHWHAPTVKSFIEEPHSFIYGQNQGAILNLTDHKANDTRSGILSLTKEDPVKLMQEIHKLYMPRHHDVKQKDVNLKRLGSVLAVAHDKNLLDMESLLLVEGVGPRTIQSLALVSEVIHGTPTRFDDPARYSFAHGGKDGHPFPVPTKVYDESIKILEESIRRAKMGESDKMTALKKLTEATQRMEKDFQPNNNLDQLIRNERDNSWKHGGRTVMGKAKRPEHTDNQLKLF